MSAKILADSGRQKYIIRIPRDWCARLAAFLLGCLVCGEIFDVFSLNNTYVEIPHIYALVLFFILLPKNYRDVFSTFQKYCVFGLKLYTVMVLLLIIPGMLRFIDTSWALTPLKGAIMYMTLLIVFVDVLILRNYETEIIRGVETGFCLNLAYAALQFFLYQTGHNYVLLQWLTEKEIMYIDNIFRAEGFFTEPSHYWLFLVTFMPLLLSEVHSSLVSVGLMLFVLFLFSYTVSGGVYAIIICFALYLIFVSKAKKQQFLLNRKTSAHNMAAFMLILFVSITAVVKILPILKEMGFATYLGRSLSDLALLDKGNSSTQQRFKSILAALALLPKYCLGSGYGMASPIIQESYHMKYFVASFSYPLTCILETGILGLLGYLLTVYTLGIRLIQKNRNVRSRALAVGCIMCFVGQMLTGRVFYPYMMLLFGLSCIEYAKADYVS